ncbi:MAG: protease HtpX [Gammaproteobacteria bacterium]|jgi:heat shock protein HtpX|nr:protease HtpX [Gammaproteobacteria bacterium]
MKRIALFLATNFAILVVISVTFRLLGLDRMVMQAGQVNMTQLLIFAAVIGFSGSIISLLMSKTMAKHGMGVQIIDEPANETQRWLVETVRRQAEAAGIGMPEVGWFESPDPNAFATGWNRNNALVAVSTGLLDHMDRDEVEAVLGHEVSHVANGDMVTLALIQGVVNTFVVFLARIVGMLVDSALRRGDQESSGPGIAYFVTSIVAELVLGVLASVIVMWFSRQREFRADAGGAQLAGRRKMIDALKALQRASEAPGLPSEQFAAFGISAGGSRFGKLFMTHPPLEERIAALERAA